MMTKNILLIILLLPISTNACLWVDGTTISGAHVRKEGMSKPKILRQIMSQSSESQVASLIRHQAGNMETSDELDAVEQVVSGDRARGIEMLRKLEETTPGKYSTAANLGTALELNGELGEALFWITEAIRRNPDSHEGTEWLHKVILEAKIKAAKLGSRAELLPVLHVDRLISEKIDLQIDGREIPPTEVRNALIYQLEERLLFVKPQDPIVADMLYAAGLLEAQFGFLEDAIEYFNLAKEYGFAPDLADRQIEKYQAFIHRAWMISLVKGGSLVLLSLVCILFGLRIMYKERVFPFRRPPKSCASSETAN